MSENATAPVSRLFPAYVIGGAAAVFFLPYFIPSAPSASSSYLFGYNNRVGVGLLLVVIAIGAIWTRGLRLNFLDAGNSQPVSRGALWYSLFAVLLGCAAMYFLAGRLGGFGESSYEIDRIWLTSIGRRPYIDFEWPFGALLLYVPLAFHHLFALSIPQAYYLFWALNCLFGVWLLYAVVNAIDYPSSQKTAIYLLFFCAWILCIMNMGTHYTLTRYLLPLYGILTVQRRVGRGDARSYVLANLQILLFTAVLLLYSPETAIAFGLASVGLYPFWAQNRTAPFFVALGTLTSAEALLFWAASQVHILDTIKASGGGADSFPIVLSPHILLFFTAIFLCACYVWQRFTDRQLAGNSHGVIAFSIPMLPAALGRCDPGHVLLNGLGIFLVALHYASNHTRFWRYKKAAFILILIVMPSLGGLWFYMPALAKAAVRAAVKDDDGNLMGRSLKSGGQFYISHFVPAGSKQKWQKHLESLFQSTEPEGDLSAIYPGWQGGYLAPFGYRPNGIGTDLTMQIEFGRYEDVENANTLKAIEDKISEMRNHPTRALLLPEQYMSFCELDLPWERHKVEILFASPYFRNPVHLGNLRQPICDYIQQHYSQVVSPSPRTFNYGLWINREAAGQDNVELSR
jgi:hypothetical protein